MYFEYDLPEHAPGYISPSMAGLFDEYVQAVSTRMEKLEEALTISGLDGATFSKYAKILFDCLPERFDRMTSDELAEYVLTVYDGASIEPPRMEWPNAITVVDTAFVREKEWQAIRRLSIGGSEAAVIVGCSPYKTPYGLYMDKCWAMPDKEETQAVFDRGHFWEPRVIQAFCDATGAKVIPETRMFRSKQYPECTANVDAFVRYPGNRIYVFEAKTTVAANYDAWDNGRIPPAYVPQMRQYPAVMNDDRILGTYIGCIFTVDYEKMGRYIGSDANVGQFMSHFVDRNKLLEENQLASEAEFFKDHVLANEAPAFMGDPKLEIETLNEVYGKADKALPVVDLDEDLREPIQEYLEYADLKRRTAANASNYEEAMSTASLQLINALGPAVEGRLPGDKDGEYYEVRYAPRSRTSVNYDLMRLKYPDAYNECVTKDPCANRIFTIKIKKNKK